MAKSVRLYAGRSPVAGWRENLITPCEPGELVTTMFVRDPSKPTGYRVPSQDETLEGYVILGRARIVAAPEEGKRKFYRVEVIDGPNAGRTINIDRPWFLNQAELEARRVLLIHR